MSQTDKFRCCYCRATNEKTFDRGDMNRGLHKRKTLSVPCSTCNETTVQNKLGA